MAPKRVHNTNTIEEQVTQALDSDQTKVYYRIDFNKALGLLKSSVISVDIEEVSKEHASAIAQKMTGALGNDELLSPAQIKSLNKENELSLSRYVRNYVIKRLSDNNREQAQKLLKSLLEWMSKDIGLNPGTLVKRLSKDFQEIDLDTKTEAHPPLERAEPRKKAKRIKKNTK